MIEKFSLYTKPLNYANLTLFPSNTMCSPGVFRLVLRTYDWSIFHHNIVIYVQDIQHMLWTFSLYPRIHIGDMLLISFNYGQEIEFHSKSLNKAP